MALIDVWNAVYTALTTDQSAGSFYDDLSGRIYFVQAPLDATLPHCVYTPLTDPAEPNTFEASHLDARYQIDLYFKADDDTLETAYATNQKLITLLDRVDLTMANHTGEETWVTERGVPSREEDAWRIRSEWRVMAHKS